MDNVHKKPNSSCQTDNKTKSFTLVPSKKVKNEKKRSYSFDNDSLAVEKKLGNAELSVATLARKYPHIYQDILKKRGLLMSTLEASGSGGISSRADGTRKSNINQYVNYYALIFIVNLGLNLTLPFTKYVEPA